PTYVQYDLGKNGANGIYSATVGSSGCPSFTSIASNANGFVFGNQVSGSPYTTGAPMNAGSGTPCDYPIVGGTGTCDSSTNQLGRIDIAVAPGNANYIYAQAQSIVWNSNTGCGSTNGCQLGAWATNDGGTHGTTNADQNPPTWFNMDTGLNTIEFYSGDISGNFASAASPQASGGAQDNGSVSVTFAGTPTGPVLWQLGVGGDGFYSRIDPVGTGTSLRFFQGNNGGAMSRCVSNCTNQFAPWVPVS